MTTREKKLAFAVGGITAIGLLYLGVGQYRKTLDFYRTQIQKKQEEIRRVKTDKQLAIKSADRWQEIGRQTFSMDLDEVQTRLRNEITHLADQSGLVDTRVTTARAPTILTPKPPIRKQKEFIRLQSAGLDSEGPIEAIVRFLFRLHAQPYMVRVKSLTLMRPSSRAAKGTLALKASLETPVLPPIKLARRITPAQLNVPESEEKPRTELSSFEDYRKLIVKRKIFLPHEDVVVKAGNPVPPSGGPPLQEVTAVDLRWTPGPGAVGHKVYFSENNPSPSELIGELSGSQNSIRRENLKINSTYYWRVDTVHEDWEGESVTTKGDVWNFRVQEKPKVVEPPTVVQPPKRPDDADFTVARILTSPMAQYVVLEDRRNPQNPPERKVELGQTLYDGTLVYLHPRGAVSEKDGQLRFHPIGEPLERGVKLLPDPLNQYGDVYQELLKLRDKHAGITERPALPPEAGG